MNNSMTLLLFFQRLRQALQQIQQSGEHLEKSHMKQVQRFDVWTRHG